MASDYLPESLRNSREFRRVYELGRRYSTSHFNAFYLRTDSTAPRLGITVTRKVGNAVIRNRCKRRLRQIVAHFFRDLRDQGIVPSGFDLVINARTSLSEASYSVVEQAFRKMMVVLLRHSSAKVDPDQPVGGEARLF